MSYGVLKSIRCFRHTGVSLVLLAGSGLATHAQGVINLGIASGFGVLGGSGVTNTGLTVVNGDVGVSPGTSITGFPTGSATGSIRVNDGPAQQAHADLATAYGALAGEARTSTLTGQDLGSLILNQGVFFFSSSAQLTGQLTLDGQGNANSKFHFQIASTLTTASNSSVRLINGAKVNNVFFQVGSSATLGTGTQFAGNILALTSITMNTGATDLGGRALAINGAVNLDTNQLGPTDSATPATPEPSVSAFLACLGLRSGVALRRRRTRSK